MSNFIKLTDAGEGNSAIYIDTDILQIGLISKVEEYDKKIVTILKTYTKNSESDSHLYVNESPEEVMRLLGVETHH